MVARSSFLAIAVLLSHCFLTCCSVLPSRGRTSGKHRSLFNGIAADASVLISSQNVRKGPKNTAWLQLKDAANKKAQDVRTQQRVGRLDSDVRLGHENWKFSGVAQAPNILLTHLLKAGGSSVTQILRDVMNMSDSYIAQSYLGSPVAATDEQDIKHIILSTSSGSAGAAGAAESFETRDYFRIGLVRSPCDYLLSMWTFQSGYLADQGHLGGHGSFPKDCLKDSVGNGYVDLYGKDVNSSFTSEEDLQRFRRWVRVTGGTKLHELSLRSWLAVQMQLGKSPWDDGQMQSCFSHLNSSQEEEVAAALAATDLSQRYDCIIHTESLESETFACLEKYSNLIEDEGLRADFQQRVSKARDSRYRVNASPHSSCKDYYDSDTEAFVWQREQAFATRVGYSSCCAPS